MEVKIALKANTHNVIWNCGDSSSIVSVVSFCVVVGEQFTGNGNMKMNACDIYINIL